MHVGFGFKGQKCNEENAEDDDIKRCGTKATGVSSCAGTTIM